MEPRSNARLRHALKRVGVILFVLIVLATILPAFHDRPGRENMHLYQAQAFLDGRFDIEQSLPDIALYEGRYYSPFPPFPAVLLMPFVAVLGISATKVIVINIALSGLNTMVLWRILRRLGIEERHIPCLAAGFFFGTGYWLCARAGHGVWHFGQMVSVSCMFLAIHECLGRGRGWLAGLLLGLSFLSRQLTLFAGIFLVALLWDHARHRHLKAKLGQVLGCLLVTTLAVGAYLLFNWMRFGDWFDTGYSHIQATGYLVGRMDKYGIFNLRYVPSNFIHMFLQGFHVDFPAPNYIWPPRMDRFGTSLTFASPFLFVSLWAVWKKRLLAAAWGSVVLMMGVMLCYHSNGWSQVNAYRYSLDFLTIVILLAGLGLRRERVPEYLWKGAIVYSVLMNVLSFFFIPLINGDLFKALKP